MASRALARAARSPDDYARVYGNILRQARQPVILHWLGEMFDPQLAGYWGSRDLGRAMEACLGIIDEHRANVDGIKISLLDPEREVAMRRRLPAGVRMYTGDDFHYDRLILGEDGAHSDALLGIFDAIAPVAAAALRALDGGDVAGYRAALEPTVPLSRHIFEPPTHAYKTGVVFLAYLNGHQSHFRMLAGAEGARSRQHLTELFRLADAAGVLADRERAAERMGRVFDGWTRSTASASIRSRRSAQASQRPSRHAPATACPMWRCGGTSWRRSVWTGPCGSSATPASGSRACAAGACFRRRRRRSAPRGSKKTDGAWTRRRRWGRRCSSSSADRRSTGTSARRVAWSPTGSPSSRRTPGSAACGSASSRCI